MRSWICGLLVLAAVVVLAACGAVLLWPTTVTGVHPTRGPAVQAAYATGSVEPVIMTPIAPRVGARLVVLSADEGDTVKAGQVLARLESDDLKSTLAQLQAQAQFAKTDYLRNAALVRQGIIARQTYDRAKANWQAADAAVATARVQYGYMLLRAPNDGRIIRRDGEIGQFLAVNQPLFWLSCLSPLRITADIDEEDVSEVAPGQMVLLRADAFPGRVFEGRVQAVTPKGDSVARSYRVRIAMPGNTPLRIGMTVEANIVLRQRKNALLVPSTALLDGAVWTVRDNRLARRSVTVGIKGETQSEIRSGLSDSDVVVTDPQAGLREGQRVRVRLTPQ